METEIIYEDDNVLVVDKPAGIVVFPEKEAKDKTLIDYLLDKFPALKNAGKPPRYGIVHRLDKDTSGILLVAKNNKALEYLQKQFKSGKVIKKYIVLVVGRVKNEQGTIKTLIARSPKDKRKQRVFLPNEPAAKNKKLREAVTEYRIIERYKNYTLCEARPRTGRKHQIRCHFAYIGNPVAGDRLYGFKSQPLPRGLSRQFLHANYIKIELPDKKIKEFNSELSQDLKKIISHVRQN